MEINQGKWLSEKIRALSFMLKHYDTSQSQPRIKILFADDYLTQHPGDFWSDIKTTGLDNEGGVDFQNGKKPLKLIERIVKTIKKDKSHLQIQPHNPSSLNYR